MWWVYLSRNNGCCTAVIVNSNYCAWLTHQRRFNRSYFKPYKHTFVSLFEGRLLIAENFFPRQIDLDCSVNCMDRGALLGLFKCTHLQKLMNVMFCKHITQVYQFSNGLRHSTIKTVQLVISLKTAKTLHFFAHKGCINFFYRAY